MFRNARFYSITGDWPASETDLSAALSKAGFTPCGPLTEKSSGWVAIDPTDEEHGLLARRLNGAELLKLRTQSRMLPPAVINEALQERVDEYRSRMDEAPGRREKRRLKAETREQLLPKALLKSDRACGYVDLASNILTVDAALESAAERFVIHLRLVLDTLDIKPLKYKHPASELMTGIFLGDAQAPFSLGRACVMQDAKDASSTVRWNDFDLTDKSIRNHVADGMHLTHLEIVYDNILKCTLDEHGVLRKMKFIGVDDDEEIPENEELGRMDAEFVLLSGTLRRLQQDLEKRLGGYA
jgi:recombination associated protein RdgC